VTGTFKKGDISSFKIDCRSLLTLEAEKNDENRKEKRQSAQFQQKVNHRTTSCMEKIQEMRRGVWVFLLYI